MDKKENKYIFVWSNFQYLLTMEMNLSVFSEKKDKLWISIDNIFQLARDNNIKCWHNKADLEKDSKRGRMLLDKKYVDKFLSEIEANYKKSWKFFSELKKIDLKNVSNEGLVELVKRAKDDWGDHIITFNAIQDASTKVLSDEIAKEFSEEEFSAVMQKTEPDIADLEMTDWEKLLHKESVTDEDLLAHTDKYPWIVAAHLDMGDVIDTLRNRLETGEAQKEKSEVKGEKNKKKREEIIEKASQKTKKYIQSFHQLSLARMKVKSCWAGMDYYLMPVMYEIARRGNENIRDLQKYYFTWDIEKILMQGKKISEEEKQKRKKCMAALWKDGKLKFLSGEEGEALAKEELGDQLELEKRDTLRGSIANSGKTRAIARILLSNNTENAKRLRNDFKEGEILVTQMTQPNIMDIARKSGAIVTDEGGMLSHAAIISREFGIPCIVGTHNATDFIQDGDEVEVDAEKGIVKILK